MFSFKSIFSKSSLVLLSSILFNSSAIAGNPPTPPIGGDVNFSINGVNAIPTLSGTMLILLSLLLFVVAMRVAKNKNGTGAKFFVMMIGTAAISMSVGGFKVVSSVHAGFASVLTPFDDSGSVEVLASPPGDIAPLFLVNEDFPTGITINSVVARPGFLCGVDYLSRVDVFGRVRAIEISVPGQPIRPIRPLNPPEGTGVCGFIGAPDQDRLPEGAMGIETDGVNLAIGQACGAVCGPDLSVPEGEFEVGERLCTDGFDNDDNGLIDRDEENCQPFFNDNDNEL